MVEQLDQSSLSVTIDCLSGSYAILSMVLLLIYFIYRVYKFFNTVPAVPKYDQNQWWGRGPSEETPDTSVKPFKVEFSSEKISKLKQKLSGDDWYNEPLENTGFQYGFNGKYLKEVVDFWKNKYNFAEREKYINQYPQFKTKIQGLDIHFLHIKATVVEGTRVIPLLLLHGWPESFVGFYKMIPLLTSMSKDQGYAFDIIVPSLPGYGYSQATSKPGMGFSHVAVIMNNLMSRLGYNKYVIQGGDWGSAIAKVMAAFYPENIYGCHLNFAATVNGMVGLKILVASLWPSMFMESKHVSKFYPLSTLLGKMLRETGFMHIQSTKPDTIGVGLLDSPVGLAAYILEKFSSWTNIEWQSLEDGGLTKKYTLTDLLDNITIYWDSRCAMTAIRLYSESINKKHLALQFESLPMPVPTAMARFPEELQFVTKWHLKGMYSHLVQISDFETGGHFAAFEEPQLLASDVIKAIQAFDNYHQGVYPIDL